MINDGRQRAFAPSISCLRQQKILRLPSRTRSAQDDNKSKALLPLVILVGRRCSYPVKAATKNRIFLSHTHADRKWAETIAKGLSCHHFNIWYDAREVFPGENPALQAARALENSQAMILVSPRSVTAFEVRSLIQYALASQRFEHSLVPVIIKESSKFPSILRRLRFVKAATPEETVRGIASVLQEIHFSTQQPVS